MGLLVAKKITAQRALFYWLAQMAGAILGSSFVYAVKPLSTLSLHFPVEETEADGWRHPSETRPLLIRGLVMRALLLILSGKETPQKCAQGTRYAEATVGSPGPAESCIRLRVSRQR